MEHRGDPSQSAALSLLAGLTLRDLEEPEALTVEPPAHREDELTEKRLASVRDLFKAVQRGAHPLYTRAAGAVGGGLLANVDLHDEVASLDDDVEMFMLAARLRDDEEGPDEISNWAKRCEAQIQAFIDEDFSHVDGRALDEVRFFLRQLERIDEIKSDRPAHELI